MKSINCPFCGSEINEEASICKICKEDLTTAQKSEKKSINKKLVYAMVGVVVLGLMALIVPLISSQNTTTTNNGLRTESLQSNANIDIKSIVVNILCPDSNSDFSIDGAVSGGSGTIMTSNGKIITNAHIFPMNNGKLNVHPNGCFVVLPDASKGAPKEIYLAYPLHVKDLSEKYDLAFLKIYDVYADNLGIKIGTYPKEFDSSDDFYQCDDIQLEDPITIYGYPSLSGGISLTVTNGIVSSFVEDMILTNAKISSGNSGGLAVGKNQCLLGVPSASIVGEYENLGVIIPINLVNEFIEKISEVAQGEDIFTLGACGKHAYYVTGDEKCECETGYRWANPDDPNSLDCVATVQCPENSILKNDGLCYCNPGYAKNLTKNNCLKIPVNAHAVSSATDVWLCDTGYLEVGNQCLLECGYNSYVESEKTCKCLPGYAWENSYDPNNLDCAIIR